jgi:cytochrome bd-type quinol oxidase subunit 2
MRKCPTCGSPFSENDNYCGQCGTLLRVQPSAFEYSFPSFPVKTKSNFMNGLFIGSGLALLIVGLLTASSLNGYYWEQTARLANSGLEPSKIHLELSDIPFMISAGAFAAIFGLYLLVSASFNQFSPSLRQALERKDRKARYGTSLLTSGIFLMSYASLQLTDQIYSTYPKQGWIVIFNIGWVITSLSLIIAGVLLLASFYLRSSKLATKV